LVTDIQKKKHENFVEVTALFGGKQERKILALNIRLVVGFMVMFSE
jgi:hypothetical protein